MNNPADLQPVPTRRVFLKNSLAVTIGTTIGASALASCNAKSNKSEEAASTEAVEFTQTALSYDYKALEPDIDARTMEIHFTKHHAGYVRKLNGAIKEDGIKVGSIEELVKNISKYSTFVRNNGGGHLNHELFWANMIPGGSQPDGAIKKELISSFGSIEEFKAQFANAAKTRFGSGWAWLTADVNGKLSVGSTPNQDNPLMDTSEYKGIPLLGLDVWEHAYYLHYQNRRGDYINAFWNVVNWEAVNNRFLAV